MSERREAEARHRQRLVRLGRLLKETRLRVVGGRRELAELVARPDLIDEALIRSMEEGRDTCLNAELSKPVLAALGISRQLYLEQLGLEPW